MVSVNLITSGFGFGGPATIRIGGSLRILRPCRPVFLCHRPDLGRYPNSRLRVADPTGILLWSIFETRPKDK